jgi:hypothetical protein
MGTEQWIETAAMEIPASNLQYVRFGMKADDEQAQQGRQEVRLKFLGKYNRNATNPKHAGMRAA